MPLVVPQGALLRLIWTRGAVPSAVNVYGVINTGNVAITQTLTNTVGAAIKAAFTSSGQAAVIQSQVALAQVGLRDVRTANMPEFLDVAAAVPGTDATEILPMNVSLCVTLRTARAGRSFRGRSFLWGYTETSNVAGAVASSAAQTAAVAWVNAIGTALSNNGLGLAILSRHLSAVNAVTAVQLRDGVWDTQRKRAIPGI
jgi:hypothetical protein